MSEPVKVPVICTGCGRTAEVKPTKAGNPRIPKGWKRIAEAEGEAIYCVTCKAGRYRLRALTFPVAEPLEGGTRDEMWAALRQAWGHTTHLANWAVTELGKADFVRSPAMTAMPKRPAVNLYKRWNELPHHERAHWDGAAQSAACLLHAVESRYLKRRRFALWLQSESLPRYRYGVPLPADADAWRAAWHETASRDGQVMRVPVVSVAFGGRRWLLRLRGGPEMRRQLAGFAQLVSCAAVRCEMALYRKRASTGAHRSTGAERVPGGGPPAPIRLMCKIVGYFPRETSQRERSGTMSLRTGRRAFLVALCPDDAEPWLLHMEHLKGLIYRHKRRLDRLADDSKAEGRKPRRRRRKFLGLYDKATTLYSRRRDAELDRASAWVVAYAARRGMACLRYDDSDRRYCLLLPWAQLEGLIRRKALDHDLNYERAGCYASGEAAEDPATTDTGENIGGAET